MITAEKVIEILDTNIRMFRGYNKTSHVLDTIIRLRDAKEEVQNYIDGKVEFQKMSWNAKDWFQEMPEWGTYGT